MSAACGGGALPVSAEQRAAATRNRARSDILSNMEIVRQAIFRSAELAAVGPIGMVRVTAEQRQIYLSEPPEFAAGAVPEPRRVERHNQMFYLTEFAQCDLLWRADG